jgi:hypothetical protein
VSAHAAVGHTTSTNPINAMRTLRA